MKDRGHFSHMYLHSKVGVSGAVASLPCPRTWAAGPEESSPTCRGTAAVTVSSQISRNPARKAGPHMLWLCRSR